MNTDKSINILPSAVVILLGLITWKLFALLNSLLPQWRIILPEQPVLRQTLIFVLYLFIPLISSAVMFRKRMFHALGLDGNLLKGLAFAAFCTFPLYIGLLIVYPVNPELTFSDVWVNSIRAALWEEIVFRAFIFGLLFRFFGWGFIPAAVLSSLFFGIGHIYQGHDFLSSLFTFLVTAVGSAWFAWLYLEWKKNIWVPVFFHLLMNLAWGIFDVNSGAAGDGYSNIFRAIVIALSVFITVRYTKGRSRTVRDKTLWVNTPESING